MSLPYDTDAALAQITRDDPPMQRLVTRVGPLTLGLIPIESPYQALMRSIIYQQLSGKAAATIFQRMVNLFPGSAPPSPEELVAIPEEALRSVGVSRAKAAAIKDLAAKTLEGVIPSLETLHALDDAEIITRLTTVRGIGRWTVEMLLIFYLGRPDVLPVTDLGIQKGFMRTYDLEALPKPSDLAEYGARWAPYRSVASWYLWRAIEVETI